MSARDRDVSTEIPAALDAEGPLRRWSRRKREAVREKEAADEARGRDPSRAPSEAVRDAREPAGDAPAPAAVEEKDLTDEDMPPIDSLDENSDYSGFLSPGVSEGLRRRALRKLFMSAVFNVRDGLDDYDEDFTNFEALGDIVTSDMRHQAEAEAERARLAHADSGTVEPAEDASGGADAEPAAGAGGEEEDGARDRAAGVPGASGHRPTEGIDAPESASDGETAGTRSGTAAPEAVGSPARPDDGGRDSEPGARTLADAAVSGSFVPAAPEVGDDAGERESAGPSTSPGPGPSNAGGGDAAPHGTPATTGAPGQRRA